MTVQNYLQIENNIVTNVVYWDGNTNIWKPPHGAMMLVKATTPAMIWKLNNAKTEYVLTEQTGVATIGFTWNGTACVTDEVKPEITA